MTSEAAEAAEASLDDVIERLEQAIGRLADGGAPLDQLVADYERASRLLEEGQALLEAAERRIAGEA